MKKSRAAEPCQHWILDLEARSCEGCRRTVVLPGDAAAKAQADRDVHNEGVISKMHQGALPGMASGTDEI